MKKVSIVLPTYNEKENVLDTVNQILDSVKSYELEIIVVDDDSPDLTWKIVEDMKNPKVKAIRRIKEKGVASAIHRGIKEAKGDYIMWMDCDLSMPPSKIPSLLKQLDEGYDIAIGSRYVKGGKDSRSFLRKFTSYLFNHYCQLVLGHGVKDYDSGFIVVKREVFDKVEFPGYGYGEYFIEFVYNAAKKGTKITEVPYNNVDRVKGKSKTADNAIDLLKYGMQYGSKVLELKFKK